MTRSRQHEHDLWSAARIAARDSIRRDRRERELEALREGLAAHRRRVAVWAAAIVLGFAGVVGGLAWVLGGGS